ncbi:MAG: hypothetical protein NTW87_07530 [Planctomycetota bacterium]|nr:hypothetical protein [Planctomycetota bacterium]
MAAGLLLPLSLAGADWTSQDIASSPAGSTKPVGADGYDVTGSGKDTWDTADGFRFVYQKVSGDCEIRVRVVSLQNTDVWAKAGVMVRQSLAPGSIHAQICTSSANGVVFQRRLEAGGESDSTAGGDAVPGNTWLRLTRSGKAVTVYKATDAEGAKWQRIGAEALDLSDPVLIGMCVTSHNPGTLCTAGFRSVALTGEGATPSAPAAASAAAASRAEPKTAAPGPSTADSTSARPAPTSEDRGATPAATAPTPGQRGDPSLAAALAGSAAKLAAEGKADKARDLCFRALANDEDCPEALYELGKMFEKEGKAIAAGDFLARAARMFAKNEADNPGFGSKRLDAERRLKKLNPYAGRLTELLTDYSLALSAVVRKVPDSLTKEEALDRIEALQLANFVPPDKIPAIERARTGPKTDSKTVTSVDSEGFIRTTKKEVVTNVPVDVERALKTAGWTTITGTWKKKAENVYEVTDGKLETPKLNGAVQVTVHKGGTGSVKVMVRNSQREYVGSYSSSSSGYGFKVESAVAKMFSATSSYYSMSSTSYRPYFERDIQIPGAKNRIAIQINEGALQLFVNDKREHNSKYPLSKEGPFIIEVDGTVTIESPQAVGQ